MENYSVRISKAIYHFEVGEYLHHDNESCKYKAFINGEFVASFEPDAQHFLHICQNPGRLDEALLYDLANQIEVHHPHSIKSDIKIKKL
jgi:hypothetical protein